MRYPFAIAWCAAAFATPAMAHSGGHAHMSLFEIAKHYAEPDHLAFLALTLAVGWLAFRLGRRLEAKSRSVARKSEGGSK